MRQNFMRRTDHVEPLVGMAEYQTGQDAEAVRAESVKFENFHGFNITSDQALDGIRLGVREDLMRAMEHMGGGRQAGLQILDHRINDELRLRVAREIGIERQSAASLRDKWIAGTGFFKNVGDLVMTSVSGVWKGRSGLEKIRKAGSKFSTVGTRMTEVYGEGTTVTERNFFLAKKFWGELDSLQKNLVTGGPVTGVSDDDLANQIANQIAGMTPDILMELRDALFHPNLQVVPGSPESTLDRLIELRETEASAREKMLGTTVYDATRLQSDVIDKYPHVFKKLDEILEPNALYSIENNAEAQVLIAYVEQELAAQGADNLSTKLEDIQGVIPAVAEKAGSGSEEAGKTAENKAGEREKQLDALRLDELKRLSSALADTQDVLQEKYAKAGALGRQIFVFQGKSKEVSSQIIDETGKPLKTSVPHEAVEDLDQLKYKLLAEINGQESRFWQIVRRLIKTSNELDVSADVKNELTDLSGKLTSFSKEEDLFGKTYPASGHERPQTYPERRKSEFEQAVDGFVLSNIDMRAVEEGLKRKHEERETKRKKEAERRKKRERVSCRQLMVLMKAEDYKNAPESSKNDEIANRRALMWTNIRIVKVNNMQVYRQANQEVAEYLGETVLGSKRLARLKKRLAASSTVLKGRDLIDHLAGFDKDFHMFMGMPKDITLTELRDLIERNGGIDDMKLFEYAEKLKQVFESFEMLNSEGKVELFDSDALDMERLIENLFIVREEIRCRKFFNELRHEPGDKNKAEVMLEKIRTDFEEKRKAETGILETLKHKGAEWKQLFSKYFVKEKYLGPMKELKKEKLSAAKLKDTLRERGFTTAHKILMWALAGDEAIEIFRAVRNWRKKKSK